MGQPVITRLKYIQRFRDRHGKVRLYFRRKGCKPVPLPAPGDPSFLAAYQAALSASVPQPVTSRIVAGSVEALARSYYQSSGFQQLGTSTQAVYRRIIGRLCSQHGDKPVALLETQHIRRLISDRAATPAAANHLLRTLRSLMQHAVAEGWRTTDPTIGVKKLKEVGEGAATWTEQDIATFEAHWPIGTKPRRAFALLLYTGQRRSDVVRMGKEHVRDNIIEVKQMKTGKRLLIPLHPELTRILETASDGPTFLLTETGRPFTANGFYMRFREWVRAAGLPDGRSPHGLRKAAARRLAESGCSPHQIASITGHTTLKEIERYTKDADQLRLAREAVAHLGPGSNRSTSVKPAEAECQTDTQPPEE